MSQSVEEQMLDTLEIFHYSYRFQNRLFVLVLEQEIKLENIITDLRVLHSAHIMIMIICSDHGDLQRLLQVWNLRGCPFEYFKKSIDQELQLSQVTELKQVFQKGSIPVIGLTEDTEKSGFSALFDRFSMNLASHFSVNKLFFLSAAPGLIIDNRFVSHTTPQEISVYLENSQEINMGKDRLAFFQDQNRINGCEIVLLEGNTGCLFQEIFTHMGRGTLITSDYPNIIRNGEISDVMDLALLMKPYSQAGSILPISEDELANEIESFYVYTVNNSMVAAAKLKEYGSAAELAKFCTLPRYQGKGRARELAGRMIQNARQAKKEYIFALSTEPKMFEFFENLGFKPHNRQDLPETWKKSYDMTRPSKAFRLKLIPG